MPDNLPDQVNYDRAAAAYASVGKQKMASLKAASRAQKKFSSKRKREDLQDCADSDTPWPSPVTVTPGTAEAQDDPWSLTIEQSAFAAQACNAEKDDADAEFFATYEERGGILLRGLPAHPGLVSRRPTACCAFQCAQRLPPAMHWRAQGSLVQPFLLTPVCADQIVCCCTMGCVCEDACCWPCWFTFHPCLHGDKGHSRKSHCQFHGYAHAKCSDACTRTR